WRHYHEGKAERVVMEAPGQRLIWERRERESDPISLARRYLDGADLVLVEGFAAQPLPKIETYRLACGQDPLYDPARPDAELWVATPSARRTWPARLPSARSRCASSRPYPRAVSPSGRSGQGRPPASSPARRSPRERTA